MNKQDNFYITTPIFYASGDLHLGHVYTATACDVLARWNRQLGKKVFFLTGSDEHGQKVAKKAQEIGIDPKVYTDSIVKKFQKTLKKMNISFDQFIRTTDDKHKVFVQKMLQKAFDNGDIYKDTYKGLYCVDCEKYYKEEDLLEGQICPDHKKKVDEVEEENYFFRLSKYQDKILELYEKNSDFLSPKSKAQETLNRVKDGLEDISISRSKEKLSWGIDLPFDSTHVTYVWFDALFNYVSALDMNSTVDEFWPANVHVIGKDIMWFHKVYFPAFLMSVGLEVPQKVFAHGWWTVEGEKMGKSMGNVLDPVKISERFGLDEFRYYMFAISSFGDDLDFSEQGFIDKINNDLNNDLGNLVSRVHTMTFKYFDGIVPKNTKVTEAETELIESLNIFKKFDAFMQDLDFHKALDVLFTAIRDVNAYINKVEPWREQDQKRLASIIASLNFAIKVIGDYMNPFMPEKAERLRKQYNFPLGDFQSLASVGQGHILGEKDNLFQKFKVEKPEVKIEKVEEKEGFAVLNLKVGKILSVEQHPEAEKLYVETIDLGNSDVRQIVSGLKDYYSIEEMTGRYVVVVANLKAAKLRGVKSDGMVLLAENDKGELGFLESDALIGTCLVCDGVVANNESKIKVDKFFKYELKSLGSHVEFEGKKISVGDHELQVEKQVIGNVR
jgi:methionyl-tRNA synthetase